VAAFLVRLLVLQSEVNRLTCGNTSTHWHSQAPDEPTRAPFATQSATHFDLVSDEPATAGASLRPRVRCEADQYRRGQSHRLSSGGTAPTRLPPARPSGFDVEHASSSSQNGGGRLLLPPVMAANGSRQFTDGSAERSNLPLTWTGTQPSTVPHPNLPPDQRCLCYIPPDMIFAVGARDSAPA
jgi:hypothetical protein